MSRRTRDLLPDAARPEQRVPRNVRVAGELRETLQLALGSLRDPRFAAVTVTIIEVSADLRSARVLVRIAFGPAGGPERRALLAALRSATGRLRQRLATQLALRFVPDLRFVYDEGPDAARRIEEILSEIADDEGTGGDG